jgi:hypothetical protein
MSEFPPIRAVLVCEALRQETGGKQTLLGFFGTIPDVEIRVANSHLPLAQLSFLFVVAPPSTSTVYRIQMEVWGPNGESQKVVETPESAFPVEAGRRIHLAFSAVAFPLAGDGTYRLVLTADGIRQPEQPFEVRQESGENRTDA